MMKGCLRVNPKENPMRFTALFAAALIFALPLAGQEAAPDRQFDFQQSTLDNGLQVVTLEDFSSPIVTVHVWYRVGSKDENPNRQGFAHMFEHMMFRGTENLPPEGYATLVQRAGGWINGSTSFDYTNYFQTLPANQLDLVLWLEAERMLFLNIDEEGYERERAVVEEERRMGLNAPYGTLAERILPSVFQEHPYRWTPIGQISHLRAATTEELRHFWDEHYVPANAILMIVGAVSHEEAQEKAKQYFGWMPKLPAPPRVVVEEPEQTEERTLTLRERLGPVPMAVHAYRGLPEAHPDTIPLQLLLEILASGQSSRLYVDLVQRKQIAVETSREMFSLEQDGIAILIAALPMGEDDLDTVFEELERHVKVLQGDGVTARELEKAKNQMRRDVVTDQITVNDRAMAIGHAAILRRNIEWLNQQLEAIDAVTVEDLARVAREYLTPQRRTTVRVLPDPDFVYDPEAGTQPEAFMLPARELQKTEITRPEGWPEAPPEEDLLETLPEIPQTSTTLENGLKVVTIHNPRIPFVSASLALDYGAWADEPNRPGVASLTLNMLTRGTEHYSAEELAEELEFNAISLNANADRDTAMVSASSLSDKLPKAMDLLAEVVQRPAFPDSELELLKRQVISDLSTQESSARYQASRELERRLFGEHPYARPATGASTDIPGIFSASLAHWWGQFARPDAAVLYLAGDVTPGQAASLAEKHFGQWQAEGERPQPELPEIPERQERRIFLVDQPGAVQSEIRIGQTAFTRGHPDYHRARVFSQILGGGFDSRLNRVIRIERGLTYAAQGQFIPHRYAGVFSAITFTQTPTTAETVRAVLEVLEGMAADPPSEAEVHDARSYLVGSFPQAMETPAEMARLLWILEHNNLPDDYFQQAIDGYNATTPEDVARVAEEHIDLGAVAIVVVGDAEQVRESLEDIAPVTLVTEPALEEAPPAL